MSRSFAVRLSLLALVLTAGCGTPTWPVSGRVVFPDGSPVTSGVIEFAPSNGGPAARASIGPDGRFVLKTGEKTGAMAGRYQIAIVQVGLADGFAAHVRPNHRGPKDGRAMTFVDRRYSRFETSGLERVVESHSNDFVIEVGPIR